MLGPRTDPALARCCPRLRAPPAPGRRWRAGAGSSCARHQQREGCRQHRRPGDQAEGCPECGCPRLPPCSASLRRSGRYGRAMPSQPQARPDFMPSGAKNETQWRPAASAMPRLRAPVPVSPSQGPRPSASPATRKPSSGAGSGRLLVVAAWGGGNCRAARLRAPVHQPARQGPRRSGEDQAPAIFDAGLATHVRLMRSREGKRGLGADQCSNDPPARSPDGRKLVAGQCAMTLHAARSPCRVPARAP